MQEDKEALFDSVDTLIRCLSIMIPFLKSLTFNTERMREQAHGGFLQATDYVEMLVKQGIPFRDAHHQVGVWVYEALKHGCSLSMFMKEKHDGIFDIG
jgi:argininosuccinate lyase